MLQGWKFAYYSSVAFWAALIAVAAVTRLGGVSARARNALLLLTSSALLLAIPGFRALDLALVWLVAAVAFAAARALAGGAVPARLRPVLAAGAVLVVLAFLAFFKYHALQDLVLGPGRAPAAPGPRGVPDYLVLIGASYFSFKAIHVVVEAFKGTIRAVEPVAFFGYMTFFPAFISGPINRYPEWAAQLAAPAATPVKDDLAAGAERIVHGLFKKFVLVPLVFPYALTSLGKPLTRASLAELAVGLYAQSIYFFFDFAGYSDLAIGSARIIGLRLPENFNRPFFQRNIRDLWSNWHMSLTSWLVDYVYWPVVRRLRNVEYFRTRPVLLSVVGMNLTFLGCGVWHGEAPHFVLWGAYHGLGISVLNVYQRQKKRVRHPALQRWWASRYSRWLGAFGTFNFFAAGLALFVLDVDQLRAILAAVLR